jgi:alkylation response protein AidB-like acyl-CoA dehydrogenase
MTELPSLLDNEDDRDLRAVVRVLLADRAPVQGVLDRCDEKDPFAADAQVAWAGLTTELGVVALPVSEDLGGGGATWRETAIVLEELGRSVTDVPFFTSAVVATSLAQGTGAESVLKELAAGTAIGAVVTPFGAPMAPVTTLHWDGDRLRGSVRAVAGALEATHLLVPVHDAILLVSSGAATLSPTPSFDMTRRIADIDFANVSATVLASGADAGVCLARTADISSALLASEQLGVAERAFAMTVDYLRERHQFGRPLGSFQALKHRLADVWTVLVQARAVARYAAACAAGVTESAARDLPVAASLAQAVCGPASIRATEECVQLHGGIGFTWEHPAHLYLKRARADAQAFGSPAWHRRRLAGLVDLVTTEHGGTEA